MPDQPFQWGPRSLTAVGHLAWDECGAAVCDCGDGLTTEQEMELTQLAEPVSLEELDVGTMILYEASTDMLYILRSVDDLADTSLTTINGFLAGAVKI